MSFEIQCHNLIDKPLLIRNYFISLRVVKNSTRNRRDNLQLAWNAFVKATKRVVSKQTVNRRSHAVCLPAYRLFKVLPLILLHKARCLK